jgi:hypothetical protein
MYQFPFLLPGTYEVSAEAKGFKIELYSNVIVVVGAQARVDFELVVGSVQETVNVTDSAPLIHTTSSDLATVLDSSTVANLPLLTRDFQQLMFINPGTAPEPPGGVAIAAVNGNRPYDSQFLVDGVATSTTSGSWGGASNVGIENTATPYASIDSIQEFKVSTSNYTAEWGGNSGAVVQVVTKGGTNEFHGMAFDYLRNDALDANDFFSNEAGQKKPPVRFNQFGGQIGGPIKKNRVFFFFHYEGLRDKTSGFIMAQTLDPAYALAHAPAVMAPLISLLPKPTGGPVLDTSGNPIPGQFYYPVSLLHNPHENSNSARVDWNISDKDTLIGRYNWSTGAYLDINTYAPPNYGWYTDAVIRDLVLTETHVFANNMLNEFRFSAQRTTSAFYNEAEPGYKDNEIYDEMGRAEIPRFTIGGTTFAWYGVLGPAEQILNSFQYIDNFSWTKGKHNLKFGVNAIRTRWTTTNQQSYYGSLYYMDIDSFLNNSAYYFSAVRGDTETNPRYLTFDAYAQDDVRVSEALYLNLGVRYSLNAVPSEAQGKVSNFNNPSDFANGEFVPGLRINGDHHNFAPRIGFAYSPFKNRNTTFRGGWGMFFDEGGGGTWGPSVVTDNYPSGPTVYVATGSVPYPVPPADYTPEGGLIRGNAANPNLKTPVMYQWNFNIERRLTPNQAVTVGYVGNHGSHLYVIKELNLVNPVTQLVPNPIYSTTPYIDSSANSTYHALQVSFERKISRGMFLLTNYTWSHAIDDSSGFAWYSTNTNVAANPYNPSERASSSFDVRHTFNAVYQLEVPLGYFTFLPKRFSHGWQLAGIVNVRSGLPYTMIIGYDYANTGSDWGYGQRPDYTGQPQTLGGRQGPDSRLNPAAFALPAPGTFGNLGRNTLRGPGYWRPDLALFKDTPLTEKLKLQARCEISNLFNHPNFNPPADYAQMLYTNNPSFGVSDSLAGGARVMQLSLKLIF